MLFVGVTVGLLFRLSCRNPDWVDCRGAVLVW